MNRVVTLLGSVLFFVGFGGATQDYPAKDKGSKKASIASPQIRYVGVSPVPNDESRVRLHFEASNPNAVALPYVGYMPWAFTPRLPNGVMAPLYHIEFRREGKWQREPIGWCGTGEGPVELPVNAKATFDVMVPKENWDAVKVGVDWFSSSERKGAPATAWSQEVTANDIAKPALPKYPKDAKREQPLSNEVLNAGLNPKDPRILALVAYLDKNGVKLVPGDNHYWHITKPAAPGTPDGAFAVSIRTFPDDASEKQMHMALFPTRTNLPSISLPYKLNAPARIAMSYVSGHGPTKATKEDFAAVEAKLAHLFKAYRAAAPKGTNKPPAEPYEGFKADQALLRKHLIHKGKNGSKDTKASSAEACEAAQRIFTRIPFLYRTRNEVLDMLGDPATISDFNRPAGKDPTRPLVYVLDSGFGGYRYIIRFGGPPDGARVRAVEVEGQN